MVDLKKALNGASDFVDDATNALNRRLGQNSLPFEQEGFIVPPIPGADGNGLPNSKIPSNKRARSKRQMAHWFVPEVGVVNMYINPSSISYRYAKAISPQRTKGGYNIQYWGEELPNLTISGTTGTSGVEGINVLYEVYRSEQLTFDSIGLTLASAANASGVNDIVNSALGNIGGTAIGGLLSGAVNGVLGQSPVSESLLPRNIPSLASLALGVEFYWSGWVFRGFFKSFNVEEKASNLGMFDYTIDFAVTQKRGYRTNFMPWHKSAIDGQSGSYIPHSFDEKSSNRLSDQNRINSGSNRFR